MQKIITTRSVGQTETGTQQHRELNAEQYTNFCLPCSPTIFTQSVEVLLVQEVCVDLYKAPLFSSVMDLFSF